jgi:hypothetical protein
MKWDNLLSTAVIYFQRSSDKWCQGGRKDAALARLATEFWVTQGCFVGNKTLPRTYCSRNVHQGDNAAEIVS